MRLNESPARGRELLELHHATYPRYWKWSQAIQDYAVLHGELRATFGWSVHVTAESNSRSLRNFPLQGNGGEMLRIACSLATEKGIRVCAPVHDALLIEAPAAEITNAVAECQRMMEEASRIVLAGFPLRTGPKLYGSRSGTWTRVGRRCGRKYGT